MKECLLGRGIHCIMSCEIYIEVSTNYTALALWFRKYVEISYFPSASYSTNLLSAVALLHPHLNDTSSSSLCPHKCPHFACKSDLMYSEVDINPITKEHMLIGSEEPLAAWLYDFSIFR